MKAKEITKGSTLLATLNKENYPFGMDEDLIDDLHRMINVALTIPVVSGSAFDEAKKLLKGLTDDGRMDLFGDYCKNCGEDDPSCQCWNDE